MDKAIALGQLPEVIYVNQGLYSLYSLPLAPWLGAQDPPINFDQRTPQCQRGYMAQPARSCEIGQNLEHL